MMRNPPPSFSADGGSWRLWYHSTNGSSRKRKKELDPGAVRVTEKGSKPTAAAPQALVVRPRPGSGSQV